MNNDTRFVARNRCSVNARLSVGMVALLAAAGFACAETPLFVPVSDAGNASDVTGFGAVKNAYRIGMNEVTRTQYAAFLNAVAATDTHGLYSPNMGITRAGAPGSYVYAATDGARSVAWVSWYDALRYANWLNNGQPAGAAGAASTETGAYTFSGETSVSIRNPEARVFLPSEDEWYKAAYYQGGSNAWYWAYPTRSDTPPLASLPTVSDNAANYDQVATDVMAAGAYPASQGYFGTHDQAGNLWEWNEALIDGDRGLRGGSYDDYPLLLQAGYRDSQIPTDENEFVGFRVAAAADVNPPPNHAPVSAGESYTVNAAATLTVAAPGVLSNDTDADGNALTAVRVSGPAHGTLTLDANGAFTYAPATGYSGADSFAYKASDGTVDGNAATVALTVNAVNRAPVAASESYAVNAGATLSVAAPGVLGNDTDADGNALTAVRASGPAHGTLTLNANGAFTYTPAAGYSGADSFAYKANDGTVDGNTATVALTVNAAATRYALNVRYGSGDGSYAFGTVVAIQADAAPAGSVFDRWTGSSGYVANVTNASTTLTMQRSATTVTATYKVVAAAFDMTFAAWSSRTQVLIVRGKGPYGKSVVVTDVAGTKVGTCKIRSDGSWSLSVKRSSRQLPSRLRATCNGMTDEMPVTRDDTRDD